MLFRTNNWFWLDALFDENNIYGSSFFKKIFLIADKKHPKLNGFILEGPTNCFKSNLLRLLFQGLNITPMTRSGRNNQFWLQSIVGQSYALWEEPTITLLDVNDWKLLLEGAEIKISIKNQPDDILSRTPFFITSNNDITKWINYEDKKAINERIVKYNFRKQISNTKEATDGRYPAAPRTLTGKDIYSYI